METLFIVATKVEGLAQQVWLRVSKSLLVVMLWEQSIGVSHNQSEVMGVFQIQTPAGVGTCLTSLLEDWKSKTQQT